MERLKIYYFSGTGNAKKVAGWIAETATTNSIDAETVSIVTVPKHSLVHPEPGEMIGFVSPTHGFNYPPVMVNFIFRFSGAVHKNPVFLVNTRAGMKLSKWFLPGLSGIALLLAALVLRLKGCRIVGMRSVDLPSNWISLHPGLKEKVVRSIFDHCKKITVKFANKILHGEKVFRALYDLPQDLLVAPLSLAYYFVGRFVIAKTFIATAQCNNCGLCIEKCPVKAIKLVSGKPYWTSRCESCMHCMNSCPQRAIQTAHGLLTVLVIVLNVSGFWMLFKFLKESGFYIFPPDTVVAEFVDFVFQSVVFFFILLLSYRLAHFLKRFRFFDIFITYTSLTSYKFWRRYKSPRNIA